MAPTVKILDINPGSDGNGKRWPKHSYIRNDEYYKEKIATGHWIKDLPGDAEPNVIYRLNKLPDGYAGFEKMRPNGDRYDYFLYGHPGGRFDSLVKFYTHFKHLMDYGSADGCTCDLCTAGNGQKRAAASNVVASRNESEMSTSPPRRSRYFPAQNQQQSEPVISNANLISLYNATPRGRPRKYPLPDEQSTDPARRRLVDIEDTPDVYESLIAKLKEAEAGAVLDVPIEESMSPDWRSGNAMSKAELKKYKSMPAYVPRIGEIVLFVRHSNADETISWDATTQSFQMLDYNSKKPLRQPPWEAGVVTQMPKEEVTEADLLDDEHKEQSLSYSGFRIEPLSEPGSDHKPYTRQPKYVPLHTLLPFTYWQECVQGMSEKDYHPTIRHALTLMSSFCVVGRYRFRGSWPSATVFCRGVYIGSELITIGDDVRLSPRKREQSGEAVTDVMCVTAIRLRLVNLDLEDGDMMPDPELRYQACLHLSGKVYTQDPARSFDSVGGIPIDPKSDILPAGLRGYGKWYHYSDPQKPVARTEVPFTRVLGRCFEDAAITAWFGNATGAMHPPNTGSESAIPTITKPSENELSRGLGGILEARKYSKQNDKRIMTEGGKSWCWADTRIEQLDLHEVNGRYVGTKREERTPEMLRQCRTALKAQDGNKQALAEYQAVKKEQQNERVKEESNLAASAYGMVASSKMVGSTSPSATEAEVAEDGDAMDVDDELDDDPGSGREGLDEADVGTSEVENSPHKMVEIITLGETDDEDELATDQLASELARNLRAGDARLR